MLDAATRAARGGAVKKVERTYRALGEVMRIERERCRVSQSEMANRVGLCRTSIVNIEAGRQRVLLHDIDWIASSLEMTPMALMKKVYSSKYWKQP